MAVVIENPLHPVAPHRAVIAVGKHGRILDRNADLVIETVGHPAADLFRLRAPRIQHHVERMVNVIGAALVTQSLFEFLARPAHRAISMPSKATSIPRRTSSARSGDSSSRIGLVLLM